MTDSSRIGRHPTDSPSMISMVNMGQIVVNASEALADASDAMVSIGHVVITAESRGGNEDTNASYCLLAPKVSFQPIPALVATFNGLVWFCTVQHWYRRKILDCLLQCNALLQDGPSVPLLMILFDCDRLCIQWVDVLLVLVCLGPLLLTWAWNIVEIAGAPSILVPALPLLMGVCCFALGDGYVITPLVLPLWSWFACVFFSAKRRLLFCMLVGCTWVYVIELSVLLSGQRQMWRLFGETWTVLAITLNQITCSSLYAMIWTRWHSDCPSFEFTMCAAFLPIGSETVRLIAVLKPASETATLSSAFAEGCRTVVVGILAQVCNRCQLLDAIWMRVTRGSYHVATAERDLFLRSYFGFSYVPIYTLFMFTGFLTIGPAKNLKNSSAACMLSFAWLVGEVATDLCVILAHRVSKQESWVTTLRRLQGPHGHHAPRFGAQQPPPQNPPAALNKSADAMRGLLGLGKEDATGILFATFSLMVGTCGLLGIFQL